MGKVGDQLRTEHGRVKAITQLVSKHAGEIVEVDRNKTYWVLRPKSGPGSASSNSGPLHIQLYCVDGGGRVGTKGVGECGLGAVGLNVELSAQTTKVASTLEGVKPAHLLPDWPAQTSRVVAPCKNAANHLWHRTGPIITLGEMFMVLGKKNVRRRRYTPAFARAASWW